MGRIVPCDLCRTLCNSRHSFLESWLLSEISLIPVYETITPGNLMLKTTPVILTFILMPSSVKLMSE